MITRGALLSMSLLFCLLDISQGKVIYICYEEERESADFSCPRDLRIQINEVLYVRSHWGTCHHGNGVDACSQRTPSDHPCCGAPSCQVSTKPVYMPVCGYATYLRIAYECVRQKSITCRTLQENIYVRIPPGQLVSAPNIAHLSVTPGPEREVAAPILGVAGQQSTLWVTTQPSLILPIATITSFDEVAPVSAQRPSSRQRHDLRHDLHHDPRHKAVEKRLILRPTVITRSYTPSSKSPWKPTQSPVAVVTSLDQTTPLLPWQQTRVDWERKKQTTLQSNGGKSSTDLKSAFIQIDLGSEVAKDRSPDYTLYDPETPAKEEGHQLDKVDATWVVLGVGAAIIGILAGVLLYFCRRGRTYRADISRDKPNVTNLAATFGGRVRSHFRGHFNFRFERETSIDIPEVPPRIPPRQNKQPKSTPTSPVRAAAAVGEGGYDPDVPWSCPPTPPSLRSYDGESLSDSGIEVPVGIQRRKPSLKARKWVVPTDSVIRKTYRGCLQELGGVVGAKRSAMVTSQARDGAVVMTFSTFKKQCQR